MRRLELSVEAEVRPLYTLIQTSLLNIKLNKLNTYHFTVFFLKKI